MQLYKLWNLQGSEQSISSLFSLAQPFEPISREWKLSSVFEITRTKNTETKLSKIKWLMIPSFIIWNYINSINPNFLFSFAPIVQHQVKFNVCTCLLRHLSWKPNRENLKIQVQELCEQNLMQKAQNTWPSVPNKLASLILFPSNNCSTENTT